MIKKLTFAFISILFVLAFSCTSSSNLQSKKNQNNQNKEIQQNEIQNIEKQNGECANVELTKTEIQKDKVQENELQLKKNQKVEVQKTETETVDSSKNTQKNQNIPTNDEIELLFAGDIMAHSNNYHISSFDKIWRDVKHLIDGNDFAFANIEAPVDTTKPVSNYPNFNMPQNYVQAAVDAGFNVFSLCNNHSNDQYLEGIKETLKTVDRICEQASKKENPRALCFSGLKNSEESECSYNLIGKNGWKILFL